MEYQECCLQNFSQNPGFKRCPECGTALIRCKSCGLLSDPRSYCPVCFYPQFLWRLPSPLRAEEMGAFELVVENQGKTPFQVKEIRYGLTGMEKITKEIEEALPPGKGQVFCLSGLLPPRGGKYGLAMEVVFCWHHQGQGYLEEEVFIYAGETLVSVEAPSHKGIHISGVAENARIIVSAPSYDVGKRESLSASYQKMELHRSKGLERKWASYPAKYGLHRKARLLFPDLATNQPKVFHFYQKNRLGFGRARVEKHDLVDHTLRIHPLEGRNLEVTKSISSHHFDLVVMAGRLFVVDLSSYGTSLNRKALPKAIPVLVQEGDILSPFTRQDYISHLAFQAHFHIQGEEVMEVEFKRI
ncbi:MAG: FHA domain-containing protein [Planctomycetota bacterium]|nr:MAG: FHA domain-containing protein [Planctomycetota bacterium]